jgi:hypothetical protein
LRVLFIGNSLTYENDLPAIIAALADSAGVARPFWYREATYPNYSLEDHWLDGRARAALEQRAWDIVVMQQGPSSLPENQILLRDWSLQFAPLIRAAGAQPALYMVWPPRGGNWDGVTRSYADAAVAVDGLLFPAGEALRAIDSTGAGIPMFQADGFHPSPAGSYLAALVMVGALTGRSTVGLSVLQPLTGLSSSQSARLEQAADQANRDHGIP